MDLTLDKSTHVGLGFATHSDAFQCGREAAQTAKSQLPDGNVDLVFVFGPGNVRFKDFVEGVRLVMGEETLVAIPSDHVISNETQVADACMVAALQLPHTRVSIGSAEIDISQLLRGTTALISQFRRKRGNAFREHAHRGCLIVSNGLNDENDFLPSTICSDIGLESWMIGGSTATGKNAPIVCMNRTMASALIGIEFISSKPWGVGSVTINSFMSQSDLVREAVKTALRDAHGQMQSTPVAFGLVIFEQSREGTEIKLANDILKSASSVLPNVPLIGISMVRHFVRRINRSVPAENDFVVTMLVPA